MKRLFSISTICFCLTSFSALATTTIHCEDFRGSTIYKDKTGKPVNNNDGYSQQDLKIIISDMNSSTHEVKWLNQTTPIELIATSENDGWMTFHQTYFANVHRIFTYFRETKEMAVVEIQTHLFNEVGNVKSFLGNCKIYTN
ncbi:hypothetical protein N9Y50_06855 [Alphaproteobacteria bacterium]|nr:hypothetical protein [Alphaproteobacteria bacterium]